MVNTLGKSIQASGVEFKTGVHDNMVLRTHIANWYTSNTMTDETRGFMQMKVDRYNNIYLCQGIAASDGYSQVMVTKFNGTNLNSILWSKAYGISGKELMVSAFDVSTYGYIGIVGEDENYDDSFVLILSTNGTINIFDIWSTNDSGRDMKFTSCFWFGSLNGEPSLRVDGSQSWYGYGGNPWNSGWTMRYGDGTSSAHWDYNTTIPPCYIFGDSTTNTDCMLRADNPEPYNLFATESTNSSYTAQCHGWIKSADGNLNDIYLDFCQLYSHPYTVSRRMFNFANVNHLGNTMRKVFNSSGNYGQVDTKGVIKAGNDYYSLIAVRTRNSTSPFDYAYSMLLIKHTYNTITWAKQWASALDATSSTGGTYSDWFNPNNNHLDRPQGFNNLIFAKRPSGNYGAGIDEEGIVCIYRSAGDTISLLHFDSSGNALKKVDMQLHYNSSNTSSDAMPVFGWALTQDMKENMMISISSTNGSSAHAMGRKNLRLPPMKRITSTNLSDATDAVVGLNTTISADDVLLGTSSVPTLYNQAGNISVNYRGSYSYFHENTRSGGMQFSRTAFKNSVSKRESIMNPSTTIYNHDDNISSPVFSL